MLGWVLLGIIGFIIILFIILKVLSRKSNHQVPRISESLGESKSFWDKVKTACCTRRR